MINTKELRRLAQAATQGGWYVERGNYVYGCKDVTDGEDEWRPVIACIDDDEPVNYEGNAAFIAAANPAVMIELLDRLEAWESVFGHLGTPDEVGNEWHSLNDRLEAAEKETKSLREGLKRMCLDEDAAAKEAKALRVKIEAMEKQEPYSYIYEYANPIDGSPVWRNVPGFWNAQFPKSSKPLYALPGAQPAPSVPSGLQPLETIRFWADAYTHPSDDNFRGRGMAAALLREYAELRAALAADDQPQELNLSDPAVQKRLAAQWGYVPAEVQPATSVPDGFALVNAAHFLAVLDREDWRTAKNRAELRAMIAAAAAAAPEAKP